MGLFDALKQTALRRGTDHPLFRKGVDKLNETLGDRRRAEASARWPLASDPDGLDVFRPLLTDSWWALNHGRIEQRDFAPRRVDGVDACGWHFGYGTQLLGFDLDGPEAAGGTTRYRNDLWIEVELEPVLTAVAFDARSRLILDDLQHHRRRVEVPDDVREDARIVCTGRFRPTGDWCAVTLLSPLVLRVRTDRVDADRTTAERLMHSVLERLDFDAFVAWRTEVHARNGTQHDPDLPPWQRGRPAGDEPAGPEPTGSAPPDAAAGSSGYAFPSPDALKAGLDAELAGPPIPIDADAIAAALGGSLERVRTLVAAGTGEGVRIQAPGGRALDVIRVTDPTAIAAITDRSVAGVTLQPADDRPGAPWSGFATVDDDHDGAVRGVLVTGPGVYYLRVRGMKRLDTVGPMREAIGQLGA